MEFTKAEVAKIEKLVEELTGQQIAELNDLQLALIGGGIGEVVVG